MTRQQFLGDWRRVRFDELPQARGRLGPGQGPFKTRKEAEDAWRAVSEENRHKAGVRFSIVEEPLPRLGLMAPRLSQGNDQRTKRPHPIPGWGRLLSKRSKAQVIENKGPLRRTWLLIG